MAKFLYLLILPLWFSGCFLKQLDFSYHNKLVKKNCQKSDVIFTSPLGFFAFNNASQIPQVLTATCINSKFIIDGPFTHINLTNLRYIHGDLSILSSQLQTFSAEYIEEISGSLIIDGREGAAENLSLLNFARLEYIGGDLNIAHLKKTKSLNFPLLKYIKSLTILDNEILEDIALPSIQIIEQGMSIVKNNGLKSIQTATKLSLGKNNIIVDNPKLPQCTLAPYKALEGNSGKEDVAAAKDIKSKSEAVEKAEPKAFNQLNLNANFIERGNDNKTRCPPVKKSFFSFLPWFS